MKKRNLLILTVGGFVALLAFVRCSEIPDGFISERLRYIQNPYIVRGFDDCATEKPNVDGSSYPLKFEIIEVKGPNGELTTVLTDSVAIRSWREPYNKDTDKTSEDVLAKIEIVMNPVMMIVPASGQLRFVSGALGIVPEGDYPVSVRMSNSAGNRDFYDIITISFRSEELTEPYGQLTAVNANYAWKSATHKGQTAPNGFWNSVSDESGITFEVEYDPTGPNEIHLMALDKNGKAVDWTTVYLEGANRDLEEMVFDQPIYQKDRAIYKYPIAPFPFEPCNDGAYVYYYRIPSQYVNFENPDRGGWYQFLFGFRALRDGKFVVRATNPNVTFNY